VRSTILSLVESLAPLDSLEAEHIEFTGRWIGSGAELCRLRKPDHPSPHLVSYFVVVDRSARKILLVDHRKALLWLPSGGHVEPDEHPEQTVRREAREELEIEATFLHDGPLFLTVTETVGHTAGHTDVSLWYLLGGDSEAPIRFDREEFVDARWFGFDELPVERMEPHMTRFVRKAAARL
jgi:8-oxo-dGTP diphosphatase